jgi:hypothetical protein
MEDCRRGEDPSAVFLGDRDRGGGRYVRLLRKIWWDVVRSGMEPAVRIRSALSRIPCAMVLKRANVLS